MSTFAPQFGGRVSRREIALSPQIWVVVYGAFAVLAASVLVLAFVLPGVSQTRVLGLAAVLGLTALVFFRMQPPEPGSLATHAVLATVYIGPALAIYAFAPQGSAAVASAMFIAPLTAVWLVDRRQIAAHYVATAVVLFIPSIFGLVDTGTVVACIALVPAIWVLGICCVVILESAEAQGTQLEQLVRRDPLTGIGNRRLLDVRLPHELSRHASNRRQLTVVTFDLNGFKALNDSVGHAAGDALLQTVASVLEQTVDQHATAVRQGGDEFCLILPETTAEQAGVTITEIRRRLAETSDFGPGITTGVGQATFPADGTTAQALLERADERLIQAKANDPNRHARPATPLQAPSRARHIENAALPAPHHAPISSVSRRAMQSNRYVWFALASMFVIFGAIATGVCLLEPQLTAPSFHYIVAFGTFCGVVLLLRKPTPIDTFGNHVVLALTYVVPAMCLVGCQPGGSIAIGAATFVGPLISQRLVDRRQIAAHWIAATVLFLGVAVSGVVDPATIVAILMLIATMWTLGACCVFVLEAAEQQGDELEGLVRRDPLTGLGNRRGLTERLTTELDQREPSAVPLSVMTLDLNGFKALNDSIGHAAGDDVLKAAAEALTTCAGSEDLVVRQGGDEFCLVLPGTSADAAHQRALRVCDALSAIDCGGQPLTTGVGIATFPADGTHPEALLAIADQRLIQDKAHERVAAHAGV